MRTAGRWVWASGVIAGALLGLGVYTFGYARGFSYLSNDPGACANCHVMQEHYDSWLTSSHHAAATCNDCHVPHAFPGKLLVKLDNGWHHSRKFTLQNFRQPIRIRPANLRVLQRNCLHCHAEMVADIVPRETSAQGELRCTGCHRSVGHMSLD
jgi:cytochrome c nitrite reductase small subunit